MGFRKNVFASFASSKRAKSAAPLQIAFNAQSSLTSGHPEGNMLRDVYFAFAAIASSNGWTLSLSDYERPEAEDRLAAADAIIEVREPTAAQLKESPAPRICLFCEAPGAILIKPDNEAAGRLAAELLVETFGCERIAVSFDANSFDQGERGRSFLRHCRKLGAKPENLSFSDSGKDFKEKTLAHFARRPGWTQALCVMHGWGAVEAYGFLRESRIEIPRDAGLLGFDDYPLYAHLPKEINRFYFSATDIARAIENAIESSCEGKTRGKARDMTVPIYYKEGETLLHA